MAAFDPKEHAGMDPDFLLDFRMPQSQWIRRVLKKLPSNDLPDALHAKPGTRWQPPMFVFGIPVDEEKLFKLAKDNGFLGIDPKLGNPDTENV
ncbi:hypothetical protein BDQ17DRAFT_727050 [Cyathus striatus]|nr:hypothetical protein BDQ17DRAFT_727050 [Cyathus striatus]